MLSLHVEHLYLNKIMIISPCFYAINIIPTYKISDGKHTMLKTKTQYRNEYRQTSPCSRSIIRVMDQAW